MVVALVLFSVSTIQEFILPIIFGLIAGTFSATCINPSLWVIFEKIGAKAKSKKA
jgi:preprotein translocase subunit SecF